MLTQENYDLSEAQAAMALRAIRLDFDRPLFSIATIPQSPLPSRPRS